MISVYDLKPKFQNLLRPVVKALATHGVTANQVTIAAMLLSFVVGASIYLFPSQLTLLLVPAALFLRMALNAVDGMLAREFNMQSSLGAILNELGDVFSDIALYLPLVIIAGVNSVLIVLIVLLAVISEMTGVIAIQIGATRRYDGPMGKSDRALVFGAITLLLGIGVTPGVWLDISLAVVLTLLVFTIVNRANKALKEAA